MARRPADPTLAGVAVVARFDGDTVADAGLGLVGLADRGRPLAAVATAALRGNPLTSDRLAAATATALGTRAARRRAGQGTGEGMSTERRSSTSTTEVGGRGTAGGVGDLVAAAAGVV
ncbi:MAG: hypothetical protein GEV10_26760 [Streptosporangiales bacterium]|nr:hypothetical protein [Streptosporangiales bacterium]